MRAAAVAVMAGAMCIAVATAVHAAVPSLSDNTTQGPPGTTFTVTGTGFCPTATAGCTTVTIQFNGTAIRHDVQVDAGGSFQVDLGAGGGSGSVLILATQNNGAIQARTYFTVTPGVSLAPSTPAAAGPAGPSPAASPLPVPAQPAGPVASTPVPSSSPTPGAASVKPLASSASGGGRGGGPPAVVIALIAVAALAAVVLAAVGARRVLSRPPAPGDGRSVP